MRTMRKAASAGLLAVCTLALLLHLHGVIWAQSIVLTEGHADAFQPKFENGQLVLYFHDDTAAKRGSVNPADVLMVVMPAARTSVPDISSFSFLGSPGADVWVMPQDQQPGILWPGLSTESLAGQWDGEQIELRLVSVSTPPGGQVFLYTIRSFTEVNHIWSSNALPGIHRVGLGVHAHMNWAFTAPGMYTLNVQACGTHTGPGAAQGRICSEVTPYAIEVRSGGAAPAATATAPPAASTPAPGSTATATPSGSLATVTPASSGPQPTPQAQRGVIIGVHIRPPSTGNAGLADSGRP